MSLQGLSSEYDGVGVSLGNYTYNDEEKPVQFFPIQVGITIIRKKMSSSVMDVSSSYVNSLNCPLASNIVHTVMSHDFCSLCSLIVLLEMGIQYWAAVSGKFRDVKCFMDRLSKH